MFANRFTVVLDANVLGPALPRNIALTLAEAGLFRPRWSEEVLNEAERYIAATIDDILKAKLHRSYIEKAFDEGIAHFSDAAIRRLTLPDEKDRHVLAAAIKVRAQLIVTNNLKDFPSEILDDFEMKAVTADQFFADTITLSKSDAVASLSKMRMRFKNPKLTPDELILRCEKSGLMETSALLSEHIQLL